jgi:maltooligosyltrehalose trehalohydrolase
VHCIQNHDQVGNRAMGNRLGQDVSPAAFRAMSTLLLLSPFTPLIFMGQEWNASTPFQYFTDHHEELGRLVTVGRRKEFERFARFAAEDVPDPQAKETFDRSRLDWEEKQHPDRAGIVALYRELLRMRREDPRLRNPARGDWDARALGDAVRLERRDSSGPALYVVANIRGEARIDLEPGARVMLWSEEPRFGGISEVPPLRAGRLELAGPSAVVYSAGC